VVAAHFRSDAGVWHTQQAVWMDSIEIGRLRDNKLSLEAIYQDVFSA
jgi:hypothetical protein